MPRAQAGMDYRPRRQQAYPAYPVRYYGRYQGFHNYYYPRHYGHHPRLGRGPEGPWPACENWDEADEDDDPEDQEDEIYEQAMFDLRARGYSQEQAAEILRRQRPQIGEAGAAPAADPQYDDAPPEYAENDAPLRRAPSPPPSPPVLSQEDPRLPSRGVPWTDPVILYTSDAFATHLMTVTLNNPHPPAVTLAAEIHDIAMQKQAERDPETEAADVVQQAMTTKALEHVSDGPRGGIWVIKATREDVLAALWELPKSTWMLLGGGVGAREGHVYVLHPPEKKTETPAKRDRGVRKGLRGRRARDGEAGAGRDRQREREAGNEGSPVRGEPAARNREAAMPAQQQSG
ncbi:hypothetical protein LTR60_002970, partial [Cryomyces antarcticus]